MKIRRFAVLCALGAWLSCSGAYGQVFTEANGLRMTESGASGIDGHTLFRRDAIASALPGLGISRGRIEVAGESVPIFVATDRRETLLRIHGENGRVSLVEGVSPKVYGPPPGRIRIGMLFAQIDGQHVAFCAPGADEWSGDVFCGREPGVSLWLVFRPRGDAGPQGELPTTEALQAAELVQIRWIADSGAILSADAS